MKNPFYGKCGGGTANAAELQIQSNPIYLSDQGTDICTKFEY